MLPKNHVRNLEELVSLQAQAIIALQQAAQALQIALQALEKAMAEKGDQQKIVFVPQPAPISNPNPFYQDMALYNSGSNWISDGMITVEANAVGGLVNTITNTAKTFNGIVGGTNV